MKLRQRKKTAAVEVKGLSQSVSIQDDSSSCATPAAAIKNPFLVTYIFRFRRFFFFLGVALGALLTLHTSRHYTLPLLELENYKILVDGVLSNLDLDEVVGANKWLAKIGVTSEALVVERYVLALTLCTDSYSSSAQSIWMMALFVSSTQNYTDYFLRLDQLIPPLPSTEDLLFDDQFQPGTRLALQDGLHAKHPVIMIPGIVSTGLEVWNTHPSHSSKSSSTTSSPCGLKYFRKRMWGTLNQLRAVLLDKQCWMDHMLLDNITGLDPPGVKLRAAQGLGAADFFMPGYWVWAKIISNLAAIGYDSNNMHLAAYDWRLSYSNLEKRDLYFSRLKSSIELAYQSITSSAADDDVDEFSKKVVVITHSMGSTVFFYFLQWVQSEDGGRGGADWPDKYLARWINIGGPMLGTPKGVASVLFGEMRDTAQLNAFSAYILEQFFSKSERSGLWRTWGGLHSLFMIGGDAIWGGGNQQDAPDDLENSGKYAPFLEASGGGSAEGSSSSDTETSSSITPNATASQVKDRMMDIIGPYFTSKLEKEYRFEAPDSLADITSSINHSSSWINPLVSPLPRFQNHGDKYNNHHQEKQEQRQQQFKILCMYGVGRPTERKYYYKRDNGDFSIDTSVNDPSSSSSSGLVQNGVLLTDGDATVPLISLGYICVDGWKKSLLLNPSHVDVVTREYRDRELNGVQKLTNLRGGPESADHVDIMGNVKVIEDLLKVVAGVELQDEISSQIHQISRRVKLKYK